MVVPGFVNPMTAKDIELLKAVASGKTNSELAKELYISKSSVNHSLNVRLYNNIGTADFEINHRAYCVKLYWQWKLGEKK